MLERLNLLNHAFGYERVAMPAINHRNARITVEIFFARRVEEILHFATYKLRRLRVEMSQAWHNIFALLLKNFLRADVFQFNHSIKFLQSLTRCRLNGKLHGRQKNLNKKPRRVVQRDFFISLTPQAV